MTPNRTQSEYHKILKKKTETLLWRLNRQARRGTLIIFSLLELAFYLSDIRRQNRAI